MEVLLLYRVARNLIEDVREVRRLKKEIKQLEAQQETFKVIQAIHSLERAEKRLLDDKYTPLAAEGSFRDLPYAPLSTTPEPSIRLLEIQTAKLLWEPIHCKLFHVPLSKAGDYEALSYCWGSEGFTVPVYIDGFKVQVTKNLADILQQLRRSDATRMIWVDAICINQKDDAEKNVQVQLMREIYVKSKRTFVWLGGDDDVGGDAMGEGLDCVRPLITAREAMKAANDHRTLPELALSEYEKYKLPQINHPAVKGFLGLFERPWFQRVWCIQEVAVASEVAVLCGRIDRSVAMHTWDNLMLAFKAAQELQYFDLAMVESKLPSSMNNARIDYSLGRNKRLLNLLLKHRSSLATNPKDKVYALLGLLHEKPPVKQKYEKNVQVEDVYREVAIAIIQQDKNLDILGAPRESAAATLLEFPNADIAECRFSKCKDLPSWVPDWSAATMASSLQSLEDVQLPRRFCASKSSVYELDYDEATGALGVVGFCVTQIQAIDSVATLSVEGRGWSLDDVKVRAERNIATWNGLKSIAGLTKRTAQTPYPSRESHQGETLQEAFWQTIVAGQFDKSEKEEVRKEFMAAKHDLENFEKYPVYKAAFPVMKLALSTKNEWMAKQTMKTGDRLNKVGYKPNTEGYAVFRPRMFVMSGRKMMKSEDGRIGLVPNLAKCGDQVVLVKGANVPLILRRKGQHWELIGEAYVHGIMQGEAWEPTRAHKMWLI